MNTIIVDGLERTPGKILCVGRNYVEHIEELGNEIPQDMVIFMKPNSSISQNLISSHKGEPIHYEGEISFLYDKGSFSAVSFGIDNTKRLLQSRLKGKSLPWERSKCFDGAALFSEFVSFNCDFSDITLSLSINGGEVQKATYEMMIYKPQEILEELRSFMTLNDGDIVMTGTPKGVGEIKAGDEFEGIILAGDNQIIKKYWKAK